MTRPLKVIEVAIGLFDRDVPPGKVPPVLAQHILDELHRDGWTIERCQHSHYRRDINRWVCECGHVPADRFVDPGIA